MSDMVHFLRSLNAKDGVDPSECRTFCPQCSEPLRLITNYRWGLKREKLPICDGCKDVYRIKELGWKEDE